MSAENMTAIEMLCANILNTRFENLEPASVDNAKKRILDIIGCAIGGAYAPGNDGLIRLVKRWGGKREATVLAYGIKLPAYNTAMVNSILCRSFDIEALLVYFEGKLIPSHNGATTVWAALALGEKKAVSGKELITAQVVGDDISARVLAASDWDFNLGWDGTGTVPMFGSTAIAGRLLGLNPLQLRNAFGIVLNQVSGTMQSIMDGATTFKLNVGTAARNGIIAAEMAQEGWTGVKDALTGRFGYFKLYTHGLDHPEYLTQYLGKKFYTEELFKPYPGGRPTHVAIDAALALARKYDIDVEKVQEVVLGLSPEARAYHYMKPFVMGDFPNGDALFSYQYSIATALVNKQVFLENFTEKFIRDPRVQNLIGKIKMGEINRDMGVELRVKMQDGREFSQYLPFGTGQPPHHVLTEDEIIAKFMKQIEFSGAVSRNDAEQIVETVLHLEKLDDVNKIISLSIKRK